MSPAAYVGHLYFLKGDEGFGSPLRRDSSITITDIDLDAGYIAGTFRFSNAVTFSDDGRSRLVSAH